MKTQKSLYLVTVPPRRGQSSGTHLVAGRPEADAYASRFMDAQVKHLPYMRTSEAVAKGLNPYLVQPIPPRDAAPQPVAAFHKPTPLWVVKHEDGTEQQLFETAEDAKACVAFLKDWYRDGSTYIVEKVA